MNVSSSSSTSYTNAAYSSNGVSGLASGIDTESIVESMLSNIQTKIDKQNQEKQQLEWKQEIYRTVIDDINSFQSKYFNLTSKSCIRLESFYNTMKTSTSNNAASVTAGSNATDADFSMQIARLATSSSVTSNKVSSGDVSTVSNKANDFEYSRTVDIKVGDRDSVKIDLANVTKDNICETINNALGFEFVTAEKEEVKTYKDADGNVLTYNEDEKKYYDSNGSEYTGNVTTETNEVIKELKFAGTEKFEISGSSAGMATLGLSGTASSAAATDKDGNEIANSFELTSTGFNENYAKKGAVNGSVDVTLDGVTKSFTIAEGESMADLQEKIQKSFGSTVEFTESNGKWSIKAEGSGRQLTISANADTMEAIGFGENTTMVSNQIIRTDTVGKLGVVDADDTDAEYSFKINGTEITYNSTDSISSIMNKINTSDAGVKMTYDELSDKFKITSTSTGEGFNIDISGDDEGLFSKLGFNIDGSGSLDQSTVNKGQNAVVNINGVTVERASNEFTYNGNTIALKTTTGSYELDSNGEFVENSDGTIKTANGTSENKVEVSTSRDVDKIIDNLKSFVEDYNSLIEKLNGYTHEKANYKDYPPLTDAQKKEMTEKEIELWEEKSKEGLLRNDKDISSFLSDMRSAMYTKGDSNLILSSIGIDSSSEWTDYGKLSIDEDELRSMLETNADEISKLFVGDNGLATRLNKICNEAASTSSGSPGSLVSLAGVVGKGTENDNTIQDRLDAIAEKLENLNRLYEQRKERYWAQFNAMETAISNMNSQTDWLSSMM